MNPGTGSIGEIVVNMVLVLKNTRFALFLVVSAGFWFLYNQVYNLLPLYTKRVIEPSPAMDIYTAANPLVIVLFQLAVTKRFGKMKPIRSIVVGTVMIGLSMLINLVPIYAAGGVRAATLAGLLDRDHQPEAPTAGGPGRAVLERVRAFWYELGLL